MRFLWRRKKYCPPHIEIKVVTIDGSILINVDCEGLYYMSKYGYGGEWSDILNMPDTGIRFLVRAHAENTPKEQR